VILPDINLLVFAHDSGCPLHSRARRWWDDALAGSEGIGLAWITLLGLIRVSTHPAILHHPMTSEEICSRIEDWLELPHVHIPHPAENHFSRLRKNLHSLGTAGNLTTDAHLATLAIERGYTLCSNDADFSRFPGLKWKNPLATD
jgi:toxin-antitoxin system PIN domain toxin